jgi:hypothetical protein
VFVVGNYHIHELPIIKEGDTDEYRWVFIKKSEYRFQRSIREAASRLNNRPSGNLLFMGKRKRSELICEYMRKIFFSMEISNGSIASGDFRQYQSQGGYI